MSQQTTCPPEAPGAPHEPAAVKRKWPDPARKLFSFPVFLGVLLILPICLALPRYPHDPDTWWHVAVGDQILRTRTWPTTETYSFTARGDVWIASEWLGEVVMAIAARLGGLTGLALLRIGLASLLFLLLYYYGYLRSGNVKASFVVCVGLLPLVLGFLWLRPQLLAYIFLAVILISLERFRQGRTRALWTLPVIFLLWVNTHGTFPIGLSILGLYWLSGLVGWKYGGLEGVPWTRRQRRQLLLALLVSVLVLPITPYGTKLAAYPLEFASAHSAMITRLSEWQPIGFGESWGREVLVLLLLFLLALVIFRPRYRVEETALLLVATYLACVHRRFFLLFALPFAPLAALLLARSIPEYEPSKDRYTLNALLIGLMIGLAVWTFPNREAFEKIVDSVYPNRAIDYLRGHPGLGPMYNDYGLGGYLIWSLGGSHPVFIDGRADVYDYAGVFSDYFRITSVQPDTLLLLRKYGVKSCITAPDEPLAAFLSGRRDWKLVYRDNLSMIFVQTDETHARGRDIHPDGAFPS